MKIRLLIICLSVFFINGTFATTLQGNISSNLTLAGSVEVIGDVNISSNVTLTFQEGASLNMHAGASLIGWSKNYVLGNGSQTDSTDSNRRQKLGESGSKWVRRTSGSTLY